MNQAELLPGSETVVDRPLIAFAFLAQATQVQGDLMSGLTPIFKPIVKQRIGKPFDANEFADAVGSLYGIKIHPWAVDDLATRLERAGLLVRSPVSSGAVEYVYANVDATFDEVTETDIRHVVQRFVGFSRPLLDRLGVIVDEKTLEDGFFDELTAIDFHSILLKPDRKELSASTLSLRKKPEEQRHQDQLSARARLDVLCAAFIVDAFHKDRPLYDLVSRIATGALLAQVVLNIQDPGKTVSLLTLRVILDAPLVMSILDLSSEESTIYARELQRALKDQGASVEVFRHSLEEVKDNLKAVTNHVSEGLGFGATARRLHGSTFRAYAGGVLADIEAAVNRVGIRIIDEPTLDIYYRHFTQDDEAAFYGMLGSFWNPLAQQRDAASVAGVMRLRQGHRARMSAFHQAKSVFVTQNPRIADCSARILVLRKLGAPGEVPPAITDRFLAGLIWILYGGKAENLTRERLLASCSAALEVRNDVMSKMHTFLTGIDTTRAQQFRAMMTDERAGQHLMQLTLGDSVLIRSTDDADKILMELESRFEEKHRDRAEIEVAAAKAAADELIRQADLERERQANAARDAASNEMMARSELDALRTDAERKHAQLEARSLEQLSVVAREKVELERRLFEERSAHIDEKLPLMQRCVRDALGAERRRGHWMSVVVGSFTFIAAYLGTNYMTSIDSRFSIVAALVASVISAVTFWNNPDRLFGGILRRARDGRYRKLVEEYKLQPYLNAFSINWSTGAVCRVLKRSDALLPTDIE